MSKENSQESLKPEPIVFGSFSVRMIEELGGLRLEANEKEVFLPNDIAQISDPESIRNFFYSLSLSLNIESEGKLSADDSSVMAPLKSTLRGILIEYEQGYCFLQRALEDQVETLLAVLEKHSVDYEAKENEIKAILPSHEGDESEEVSEQREKTLESIMNVLSRESVSSPKDELTDLLQRNEPVGTMRNMIGSIRQFEAKI